MVVSCTFFVFYSSALVRRTKCTRHKTFVLVTFPNIHRFGKKILTDSAINFLPLCLKYFATLPCNFSLIACFLTSMFHKAVWQNMQSVVRLLIILLRWKLTKESIFQWKKIVNRLRFDSIMVTSLEFRLFGPSYTKQLFNRSTTLQCWVVLCTLGLHEMGESINKIGTAHLLV